MKLIGKSDRFFLMYMGDDADFKYVVFDNDGEEVASHRFDKSWCQDYMLERELGGW